MKKRLCALAALILLSGCGNHTLHNGQDHTIDISKPIRLESPAQTPDRNGFSINVKKEQIYVGNLLLIDREHAVPPDRLAASAVKLIEHKELMKGFGLLDDTVRLSRDLTHKFAEMVSAAAKDGVDHFLINSGYRDEAEQNELYKQMGADRALPAGHSEHNLGLSLDIGSTLTDMNQAPEGRWLADNSWKYGFVLRYPKDKTAVTGIMYEPWHFRYVGLPHSAIMKQKNWTLEQYLANVKKHSISKTIAGHKYEILYYPISMDKKIHVPVTGSYEISGNNEDGVIISVDTSAAEGADQQ